VVKSSTAHHEESTSITLARIDNGARLKLMSLTYIQQAIKIKQLEEDNAYLQLALTEQRTELTDTFNYCEILEDILAARQGSYLQ